MEIPLQITSRDFELTEVLRSEIEEKAEKLSKFHSRITRCRVTVEAPHRHNRNGRLYNVRLDITVPGAEIVIKHEPNEDIYVSIRDAFKAARRKLEDTARKQRGDVKRHETTPSALISSLFQSKGYGFITTDDGKEIYFHQNSVLNQEFYNLEKGQRVRFVEQEGDKGPQASQVSVIQ
ncbi:MAG: HPF/RaiA family ribosome-associated protein [Nitrospira sp.]|nr:HPF/RaiA family ribosome-associated protein [bacterium]MBL7048932.1 HPF/RaiA family ribosome-associated protein [Nitrospira sp.]